MTGVRTPSHVATDSDDERAWAAAILGLEPTGAGALRPPTIAAIQRATAAEFGLSRDDLLGCNGPRSAIRPRQVAMFLARELTAHTHAEIGRSFASRDHTTVVHAVKRITHLLAAGDVVGDSIDWICRALGRPAFREDGR